MVFWKLKSCPRCGGDIFTAHDLNGEYEQCLQCCYRKELLKKPSTYTPPAREHDMLSSEQPRGRGRPKAIGDPGFQARYKAALERIINGTLSRRRAAQELGVGYGTLKALLDSEPKLQTQPAKS